MGHDKICRINYSDLAGNEAGAPAWGNARKAIKEVGLCVITSVFSSEEMLTFRRELLEWSDTTPVFPNGSSPGDVPDINFHRIDDGVIVSSIPHVFHQFGIGNIGGLESNLGELTQKVSARLLELQNGLAETDFGYSFEEFQLKILHYPAGGGFLTRHTHPLEPQRVGLILSGSRPGTDYTNGGTIVEPAMGDVELSKIQGAGDLVAFRYDLPHAVNAIDEDKILDWTSDAGKWSIVLDFRITTKQSSAN